MGDEKMNVFGIDLLQLIIYICVATSCIVVIYILKLTRSKKKTQMETAENELQGVPTEVFKAYSHKRMDLADEQLPSEDKTVIEQLITLIDKMYSHQVGLTPTSTSNPERQTSEKHVAEPKEEEEPKPTEPPPLPLSHVDEETYVPTSEDQKLIEKIRKLLKQKE